MINWLPKKKLNYSWANNKWLHRRSSEVAMKEMTKRIFWFNEKVLLIAKAKRWHFQHLYLFVPYLADVKSMWLRNYTHTHTHTHINYLLQEVLKPKSRRGTVWHKVSIALHYYVVPPTVPTRSPLMNPIIQVTIKYTCRPLWRPNMLCQ